MVKFGTGKVTSSRVETFKGLELLPNEKLKKFVIAVDSEVSLFPYVKPLLPAGSLYHLIDIETGFAVPYLVGAGYEFRVVKMWGSADQPTLTRTYFEGQFVGNASSKAGNIYSEQEVDLPTSSLLDPDFSDTHILDATVTNVGLAPMYGTAALTAILIDHRTDEKFEHDTKQVRCPFCGDVQTVPIESTHITCAVNPRHKFIVEYHPWGGI